MLNGQDCSDGMGGPYVDMARERGLNVTGVLFGAQAMQPQRFRNRRAEMFWRLREFIAEGGCLQMIRGVLYS